MKKYFEYSQSYVLNKIVVRNASSKFAETEYAVIQETSK